MALITKPSDVNKIWASGGDIIAPGDSKIATGWVVEIPPRQYFNYIDNKQDSFIAHANQHGVPAWDDETEYQEDKSYVQGPTNGTIYRCIQTHTNQNPETDLTNVYWIIAFASAGDFYTKTETDGLYLAKASNLADLTNTATARTNLSVYSQAQTYTKTEVDNKTTVASTAQAQALTSNTTLITPLRLSEAFKGSNQSLTLNGYQVYPGGLIVQWGISSSITSGSTSVQSLPITFPNAAFKVFTTFENTSGDAATGDNFIGQVRTISTANFSIRNLGPSAAQYAWMAIGY